MDLNLLETQFFVQAMECKAFLQTIEKARKSILELEQEELEWMGTKDPKGLQFKINELRSLNIKVHETEQNLIENAIKVKENKTEKTETLLESKLKKLIWQEKAANKSRIECIKAKLDHEKELRQALYKILKHLSKCEVFLRLAKANRDECADDLVQLEPNIDAWLRSKKADLDRLAKYHGLLHKQKGFEGGLVLDDTTSTSSVDTASEAGSDITPLSILQENALTVEKQMLEEDLKLAKEKKGYVLDRIESIKAANKDMKEKLDSHQKVKEENRRLECAIEETLSVMAKLVAESVSFVEHKDDTSDIKEISEKEASAQNAQGNFFGDDTKRQKKRKPEASTQAESTLLNNKRVKNSNIKFGSATTYIFERTAAAYVLPDDGVGVGMTYQHSSSFDGPIQDSSNSKIKILTSAERDEIIQNSSPIVNLEQIKSENIDILHSRKFKIGCSCKITKCQSNRCSCYLNKIPCMEQACFCCEEGCQNNYGTRKESTDRDEIQDHWDKKLGRTA